MKTRYQGIYLVSGDDINLLMSFRNIAMTGDITRGFGDVSPPDTRKVFLKSIFICHCDNA